MVVLVLPGQEGNRHSHYPHSFGFGGGEVTFSKVVDECVQLHGGYGYMQEYPIMAAAEDYPDWISLANEHDKASGKDNLCRLLDDKNYHGLLFALSEGGHGNIGGMGSPRLNCQAQYGTKQLVDDYVSKIVESFLFLHAVLDQKYTGDINIILEKKDFYWRNALFEYLEDQEIENLIMAGRRSTWSKVPMIRNASVIGRALGEILESLDLDELSNAHTFHKQHITPCA